MADDEGLKRVIGVRPLAANAVNLTVGAGIFALPAVVAAQLGAAAWLAYVVCAVLLSLVLLCFVEVGSKITTTGGAYSYVEAAFGPFAGFLTNTLFWLGFSLMADAAVANVMVDNLAFFFPFFSVPVYRGVFLAVVFAGLAVLHIRGTRESSMFVAAITLVKLAPLLLLIGVGAFQVEPANLAVSQMPTAKSLGEGALLLFFAFGGGVETTLSAAGEIKNPKRTIPRAFLLAVVVIFFIYLSIQLVAQGVLGESLALEKEAPLAAVAERLFGNYGAALIAGAAALSCFALISGDTLVTSRLPYAAARDELLPSFLAKLHPRFATPYTAIVLFNSIGFLLSISGGFRQLAILSSASILLIYVGVIAATIRLRKMKVENAFTIPGGLVVPVLALIATGWFLSNLSRNEFAAAGVFILFFAGVFFFMRMQKKFRQN